jgi:hypothetical protein
MDAGTQWALQPQMLVPRVGKGSSILGRQLDEQPDTSVNDLAGIARSLQAARRREAT